MSSTIEVDIARICDVDPFVDVAIFTGVVFRSMLIVRRDLLAVYLIVNDSAKLLSEPADV